MMTSIQHTIENKLKARFEPRHIDVENESHNHAVPENSETHFKVVLVSESFSGLARVKRHQLVYGELQNELEGPVHALALHLYTEEEWSKVEAAPASPECASRKP